MLFLALVGLVCAALPSPVWAAFLPGPRCLRPSPLARRAGGLRRAVSAATPEKTEKVRKALTEAPAILAPLTRGGNLPFRVLCAELYEKIGGEKIGGAASAETLPPLPPLPTVSEMVYARFLLKGDPTERARMRFNPELERCYGVQIATNKIEEGVGASQMIEEAGASFVDLNCGCPIYDATRRGVGSALLRRPDKLARLVSEIAEGSNLPLTVKIRTGPGPEGEENVMSVVESLARTQACAAITIHGRTQQQRYSRAAKWPLIEEAAAAASALSPGLVVVGNGDVLTHYEMAARRQGAPSVVLQKSPIKSKRALS